MTVTKTAVLPLAMPGSPSSKRKHDATTPDSIDYRPPTKRISPFLNTPKQRRDERRKLFRISLNKLREIDDSEAFLCRSVLISNFARRMQKELKDEKLMRYPQSHESNVTSQPWQRATLVAPRYQPTPPPHPTFLDDTFMLTEKITDDMSDSLIQTLDALGGNMTSQDEVTSMVTSEQQSVTSQTDLCSGGSNSGLVDSCGMTEKDRQILGEMDAVFNSILSMFSDSLETQTES